MTIPLRALLTSLLLGLAAGAAQATPPKVALLPEGVCNDGENGNDQILLRGKHAAGRCLVQGLPGALREDGSSKPQDQARLLLDGELLTVTLVSSITVPPKHPSARFPTVGTQETSVYASADGLVRVSLKARITSSSCAPKLDKGCSDDYQGRMTVERGGERSVVAIDYARGS